MLTPGTATVYEAYIVRPGGQAQPVEVEPFTRNYEFDNETAAIDKARENSFGDDLGYWVMKVEKTYSIAWEGRPPRLLPEETQHNATGGYPCTECGHRGNGQVPGCTCIGCDDTQTASLGRAG